MSRLLVVELQLHNDVPGRAEAGRVGLQVALTAQRASGGKIELLSVKRAHHGAAPQKAIRQHAAAVWAVSLRSEQLTLSTTEHRQLGVANAEGAPLAFGDRVERRQRHFHAKLVIGRPAAA